jgi:hypothetical protein
MMLPLLALITAETVGKLNSLAPAKVRVSHTFTPNIGDRTYCADVKLFIFTAFYISRS